MDEYGNTITALKLLRDNVSKLQKKYTQKTSWYYDGKAYASYNTCEEILDIIDEMIGEELEEGEDE